MKYKKAKDEFEKNIPVGVKNPYILNDYASIYFELGDYQKVEPFLGILHNTKKQVDSSNTQNSKDNRIPLPPKVI